MHHTIFRFLHIFCILPILLITLASCTDKPLAETVGEDTALASESSDTVETLAVEPTPKDPEPSDHIAEQSDQIGILTEFLRLEPHTDANGIRCSVLQGACTDGTYCYAALNDGKSSDPNSISAIRKYDLLTGELVKTYEGMTVSHGNDMTVNTDTGELIIVHNAPDRTRISLFDLETMTLKEKKELTLEIYSIAYDPDEKCYWVGISHGYDFAKLDLEFNRIGDIYKGRNTGFTKQGMDVDSKYIYFVQYKTNCIIVYDKAGRYVKQIDLSIRLNEAENIFHIGDTFYIGYYTSPGGGSLYKTQICEGRMPEVSADTETWLTVDRYKDESGMLFATAQSTCTDGTHLYLMLNNDQSSSYRSVLVKIELASGKIAATAEGFETGITNDITYNPKTKQILVVHNSPDPNKITVIDAESMAYVETKTVAFNIYGLAYDEVLDCYWAGLSGCYDFVRLNTDLEKVGDTYDGYESGYTKQGMDCDGKYLYFVLSAKNSVAVYKTDGSFVGIALLPESANSAQNLCHVGDTFYLGLNIPSAGGYIHKASFRITE